MPPSQTYEYRAPLGATALRLLVISLLVAGAFTWVSGALGLTPIYWVRLASYVAVAALALVFRQKTWTCYAGLAGFYVLWWIMPIVDLASARDYGYSARTTMSMALLIVALAIPPLAPVRARWLVPALAVSNGAWVLITGLQAGVEWPVLNDEMVAIVLGYILLASMTERLLGAADQNAAVADRSARMEGTLAEVSEMLLARPASGALRSAVDAVRRDMRWDVLILEECGGPGDTVRRTSSIAGHVEGLEGLQRDSTWCPSSIRGILEDGSIVEVEIASLPRPERSQFAGLDRLVCCPIMIEGQLLGVVSAAMAGPDRSFPDDERLLLKRLGDMVGSYWEREAALGRLEDLLRSKDRFIASVSHELRTPLTAVVGLSQVLAGGDIRSMDLADVEEHVEMISTQSAEMAQIVEDLLVAARAESGLLTVRVRPVELRAEVDGLVASLGILAGRSVHVTGGPSSALVDPLRFRQIIRNLLSNAIRYGGTHVEVRLYEEGGRARIAVSDDGAGIPAHLRELVFEPYTTAHTTTGVPDSMGLGLSVSRDLARLMGGDLEVETGGAGATFVGSFVAVTSDQPRVVARVDAG